MYSIRRSGTPIRSRPGLADVQFRRPDSIQRKSEFLTPVLKFADGFLEEISKVCNVMELQSGFSDAFQVGWDFEGPQLSGRIIDEILKV
ncbi:hypothetical protein RclHR1_16690003 [Rhizophagus clarus]|uniref:Uncharacterized protein n=1 Tax=Rhizophagus clarus TaxID=94130 RepID=A0A2Z6QVH3_9GLOM|nr:hypothetical protein RclHR1_16690003 [Rhizophagus clarus]